MKLFVIISIIVCLFSELKIYSIEINGDIESLEPSDIPLPKIELEKTDTFDFNVSPEKELSELLDDTESISGIDDKEKSLEIEKLQQ